jgi:hypothetical protein
MQAERKKNCWCLFCSWIMCSHQTLALLAWVCFDCSSNVQVTRVCEHECPSKFNKNSNCPRYELQVSSERGFNSCCCVIRRQRQHATELSSHSHSSLIGNAHMLNYQLKTSRWHLHDWCIVILQWYVYLAVCLISPDIPESWFDGKKKEVVCLSGPCHLSIDKSLALHHDKSLALHDEIPN